MNRAARGLKLCAATLANVIIGVGALAGVWLNVSQPLGDAAMPPALVSGGGSEGNRP